jgi:hypothetical protein
MPNAGAQARLKAEAQRTLEAVACSALFGQEPFTPPPDG